MILFHAQGVCSPSQKKKKYDGYHEYWKNGTAFWLFGVRSGSEDVTFFVKNEHKWNEEEFWRWERTQIEEFFLPGNPNKSRPGSTCSEEELKAKKLKKRRWAK